jgi:Tfp pilus assembly protein PilF
MNHNRTFRKSSSDFFEIEADIQKQAELDAQIEAEIARTQRRIQLIVVAVIALVVVIAGYGVWDVVSRITEPVPHADELFNRALELESQGSMLGATKRLRRVLADTPERSEARWKLGTILLALGDGEAAEKEIQRAELLGKSGLEIQRAKLEAQLFLRRYSESLVAGRSITAGTRDRGAALMTAEAQLGLGYIEQATETVTLLLGDADNRADALLVLIRIHLATNDLVAAANDLLQVRELTPDKIELRLLEARLQLQSGRYRQARQAFEELLDANIRHPEATLGLAQALLAEGKPKSALAALKKLGSSEVSAAAYLIAVGFLQQGDLQSARANVRDLLKKDPEHLDAMMLAAHMNVTQREFRQAENGLRRLLKRAPDHFQALKLLVNVHLKIDQLDSAQVSLDVLVEQFGENSELLVLQGQLALARGDEALASKYLDRASLLTYA